MNVTERAFHDSIKPRWGADGTIIFAGRSNGRPVSRSSRATFDRDGLLIVQKCDLATNTGDIRFARFSSEVWPCF